MLIAVVLGPLAETRYRQALAISEGDYSVLVGKTFSVALYALLVLGLVVAGWIRFRRRSGGKTMA